MESNNLLMGLLMHFPISSQSRLRWYSKGEKPHHRNIREATPIRFFSKVARKSLDLCHGQCRFAYSLSYLLNYTHLKKWRNFGWVEVWLKGISCWRRAWRNCCLPCYFVSALSHHQQLSQKYKKLHNCVSGQLWWPRATRIVSTTSGTDDT